MHVGPDGVDRAVYRKVHMFDVEVGGTSYEESAIEEPGDDLVVTVTDDGVPLGIERGGSADLETCPNSHPAGGCCCPKFSAGSINRRSDFRGNSSTQGRFNDR